MAKSNNNYDEEERFNDCVEGDTVSEGDTSDSDEEDIEAAKNKNSTRRTPSKRKEGLELPSGSADGSRPLRGKRRKLLCMAFTIAAAAAIGGGTYAAIKTSGSVSTSTVLEEDFASSSSNQNTDTIPSTISDENDVALNSEDNSDIQMRDNLGILDEFIGHNDKIEEVQVEDLLTEQDQVMEDPTEQEQVEELPTEQKQVEELPAIQEQAKELPTEELPSEQNQANELPAEQEQIEEHQDNELPAEQEQIEEDPTEQNQADELPAEQDQVEDDPTEQNQVREDPPPTKWPSLMGLTGEEAKSQLESMYGEGAYDIVIHNENSPTTRDYRFNRIRIFTNDEGVVVQIPRIG